MTKSKVQRALILVAGVALVLGLSTTTASAAPAQHQVPAKPAAQTTTCKPASEMSPTERGALRSGVRVCRLSASDAAAMRAVSPDYFNGTINKTTSVASFFTNFAFKSKYDVQFTSTALRDTNCDGRSVYADGRDPNGFLLEYINTSGCNHTEFYPDEHIYDNDGMKTLWFRIYACSGGIPPCSSTTDTSVYSNSYWG